MKNTNCVYNKNGRDCNWKINSIVVYNGTTKDKNMWGKNNNPALFLSKSKEYVISDIEVHKYHTKIWVKDLYNENEFQMGPFNSVCFSLIEK